MPHFNVISLYFDAHYNIQSLNPMKFNHMDKSNIRISFEYEFHRGTNAAQATRNINKVFGRDVVINSFA